MTRAATIGRRSAEDAPLSDATCTPKWLADMLPAVDFDPCSNPRSHIRARWSWSLEKGFDGLRIPWRGTGFLNWPYSAPLAWAEKAIAELASGRCTDLIVLCKNDTSTKTWERITSFDPFAAYGEPLSMPPDRWDFNDRIQFDEHPDLIARRAAEAAASLAAGKRKGRLDGLSSNNFCSTIIHHRGFRQTTNGALQNPALKLESVATLWRRSLGD